jgi:hypothetical protein
MTSLARTGWSRSPRGTSCLPAPHFFVQILTKHTQKKNKKTQTTYLTRRTRTAGGAAIASVAHTVLEAAAADRGAGLHRTRRDREPPRAVCIGETLRTRPATETKHARNTLTLLRGRRHLLLGCRVLWARVLNVATWAPMPHRAWGAHSYTLDAVLVAVE